ncbi:hypothetical protein [Candidatus Hecatella orcuttiae]|uniref:hypothetical protein n=1 Tax=Candidatus Hecatella orcuttiae TaxID=1935119 RepID=UPI0028681D20|nr:hypothetical protein [Candidatus Hecatella orcuttiae]
MRRRLLRYWTYFRRGHSVYLIFAITFLNFIVIQYRLLIEYIPTLQKLFSHLIVFMIVFFVIYIPLATIIGWTDVKRGAVPINHTIMAKANPYYRDLAKAIILLADGKNAEAIKLMKKWAESD